MIFSKRVFNFIGNSQKRRFNQFLLKMRLKLIHTRQFLVLALFFCGVIYTQAQTLYALKIDRNVRNQAEDITRAYQPRLVLGTDQALEFQNTVAKYLVKKKSILDNPYTTDNQKNYRLKEISSHESSEMVDVLYSYQWQEYLRIKPEIQPLPYQKSYFDDAVAGN